MEEFTLTPSDKQETRIALLRYYSSECVAHGAYLVALAVGSLSLIEVTPFILDFAESIFLRLFPKLLTTELVRSIVISPMLSGFVIISICVLGRAIVWGYLRGAILNVKPKERDVMNSKLETTDVTLMQQLHEACFDYVKKKHKIWIKFYTLREWNLAFIWFDLFVVFLLISIIPITL